ncbi:MAG: hypothetical protein LC790_12590 [Actinobacteria bacterium]|nr:hypothetical protein [Actinomycetota bacterium]
MFNAVRATRREISSWRLRTSLGAIALIVLTTMGIGTISASAGSQDGENQLVGSWMVSVDRGPALPALKSLQTYTKGRGVIEISNGGTAVRSPAHGAWERTGGRTYGTTVVFFRYDPSNGAYIGTLKIRHSLELAPDGQSFTGVAVGELRDTAGNLLPGSNTRRDAIVAERINVEPIP